jgi:large subunit ribosomal protein L4
MPKAQHVSVTGASKRSKFDLPETFDGSIHQGAMYHAVRAFLANRRQGTHATKTRAEVSGGGSKPWRQKGTGRARQGTIRAAQWRGGGVVFGPHPRSYTVRLPRKVRRLARQSALNARVNDDALYVIESFDFKEPKTRQLVELLNKMQLDNKRVLLLTADHAPMVYLSGRNLQDVFVMKYDEASAYEVLWSDVVVIEEAALSGGASDDGGGDDA